MSLFFETHWSFAILPFAIIGVVFQLLQEEDLMSMFKRAEAKLQAFNQQLADLFRTTSAVVVHVELGALFLFGWVPMGVGESALSVACWIALGILLLIKVLAWPGVRGSRGLTALLRVLGCAAAILFAILLTAMTDLRKPVDEPWSNLQKLGHDRHALIISPGMSIVNMNRNFFDSSYFWVWYQTGSGPAISPVAVLIYLDITNTTPLPKTVSTYSLSIRTRHCDWVKLTPIYMRTVVPYFVGSGVKKAMRMDFQSNGLEDKLSSAISGNQSIHGWLMFDTKTVCKLKDEETQYRFYGDTFTGDTFDSTSNWSRATKNVEIDQSGVKHTSGPTLTRAPGDTVDLSSIAPRFYAQ